MKSFQIATSFATLLVFLALFNRGHDADRCDRRLRLGFHEADPQKHHYKIAIAVVSVVVAALIGGIEALGLIGDPAPTSCAAVEAGGLS